MKVLSIASLMFALILGQNGFAAHGKEFRFTFEFRTNEELSTRTPKSILKFEYQTVADSYEEAFKEAAKACYRHFKDGRPLTENEGLDIIDTCANPRG